MRFVPRDIDDDDFSGYDTDQGERIDSYKSETFDDLSGDCDMEINSQQMTESLQHQQGKGCGSLHLHDRGVRPTMAASSYDELLKQVECLKAENSHLRRELQDNSSHLTKLENEASNMKDVLSHLQLAMQDDMTEQQQFDEEQLIKGDNCGTSLDNNCNDENNPDENGVDLCAKSYQSDFDSSGNNSKKSCTTPSLCGSPAKRRSVEREYLAQDHCHESAARSPDKNRNEDEEQKWCYSRQLELITCRMENHPLSNTMEQEKRDSGACDLTESDNDGIVVKDACTDVPLCREGYILKAGADNNGYACNVGTINNSQGEQLITMSTQTPQDTEIQEQTSLDDGAHPSSANMLTHQSLSSIYHGTWPIAKGWLVQLELSNSGNHISTYAPHPYGWGSLSEFPTSHSDGSLDSLVNQDTASMISFNSSNTNASAPPASRQQAAQPQLGTKVEMVYSLLSMLGTHDKDDMSRTLLAMSSSQDSCIAMRQSGCLPLLIQLLHGSDKDSSLLGNTRGSKAARARAAAALHNIVHSHPDDKRGRREARVLRLLEQIRAHCDQLRDSSSDEEDEEKKSRSGSRVSDIDHHPGPAIAALMKLSFDEEHRHAICTLGGLQAIGELLQVDHEVNGNTSEQYNITMRRYACMALTNLTFGDGTNKALLCSMRGVMDALIAQLHSTNEDLCQVAASVLRNLSWRADLASKKTLREVSGVTTLMKAAMRVSKESTLKSILSALWNLSAHCSENKADICAVEGAVEFLVSTLTYKSPSKTLAIIENGGGVLRNVSSHIAVREDYRKILRQHGCLQILLKHLRSPSLTIVSNACGTLWNLSARCPEDQRSLWEMGAVSMLRNLVHSKHRMISMGSAAALKNLLAAKPATMNIDSDKHMKSNMPTLHVRKQRALEAEIDQNLAETCENMESPRSSPTENRKQDGESSRYIYSADGSGVYQVADFEGRRPLLRSHLFTRTGSGDGAMLFESKLRSPHRVVRSGSQDSVGSAHSDISHDRSRVQNMLAKSSKLLYERHEKRRDSSLHRYNADGSSHNLEKVRPVQPINVMNDDDEPVNYSTKYVDHGVPSGNSQPKQNSRPPVKVGNFVGPPYAAQQRMYMYVVQNAFSHKGYQERNIYNNRVGTPSSSKDSDPLIQTYSVYAETDLDNIDQPTDYSIRYAEHTEDQCTDQPINFGSRYEEPDPNCADCRLEEARRTNERVEQSVHSVHDDSVRTFCTEDTPLNYLSTATSLTDLSSKPESKLSEPKEELKKDVLESCAEDEIKHFSSEYQELQKGDVKSSRKTKSPGPSAIPTFRPALQSMKDYSTAETSDKGDHTEQSFNDSNEDQAKTYCEEGTPICFSRVSSLSSLHSSDATDQEGHTRAQLVLQSIDENEAVDDHLKPATKEELNKINGEAEEKTSEQPEILQEVETGDREHKTVTFDDSHHVEETPLMFSRCSSLGSLSSFEVHSVHSSVVSEYSRRASEVVSPSELPDSPSETFPPSPTRKKTTEKSDNVEEQDVEPEQEIKEFTSDAVEDMKTVGALHANGSMIALAGTVKLDDLSDLGKMDSPVVYAMEGTPPNFSETTSLSALTFSDDEPLMMKKKSSRRSSTKDSASKKLPEKDDKENSSMSEVSEGEEDILAQCISSAMPSNSNRKMRRSTSDNALKKKSESWKMETLSNAKSKHSLKSPGTEKAGFHSLKLKCPQKVNTVLKDHLSTLDINSDAVKSYATEGTPLNFSRTTSLSDLSVLTHDDNAANVPRAVSLKREGVAEESDNSSLYDENDDLLSEVIQSAKPKGKFTRNIPIDRTAEGSEDTEKFHFQIPAFKDKKQQIVSSDSMKTYAVEGTPINFSTATSLSDLTIDSAEGITHIHCSVPRSGKLVAEHVANQVDRSNNVETNFAASGVVDSPRHYMTEGTPVTFSRNDSLSSLSCDEGGAGSELGLPLHIALGKELPGDQKKLRFDSKNAIKLYKRSPDGDSFPDAKAGRQVIGQSSEEISENVIMDPESYFSDDQPKRFALEDTPVSFSRNSSLSSLKSKDNDSPPGVKHHVKVHLSETSATDQKSSFKVEGTPLCFSRNSSLSSLSVESVTNDFSQSEEALLEECISSAMPKSRSSKADRVLKVPSRLPKVQAGECTVPSQVKEKRSPPHTSDLPRCCSNMSRSIEERQMKYLKSPVQAEEAENKGFSTESPVSQWRKQPHKSFGEITASAVEARQRFGWCRSRSQDSDGFLKRKKDYSNFEIAQASSASNRPFLGLLDTSPQDVSTAEDNRLLEEKQKSKEAVEEVVRSLPFSLDADSNSSIEKIDSEKSDVVEDKDSFRDQSDTANEGEDMSVEDIMKESYPDIISDETAASDLGDEIAEMTATNDESEVIDDGDRTIFEHEISPEEERALEENASLIVSELITKRELSISTFDEDSLIENETISLVSNDYTSDTASDVSISWSTTSEKASEYSGSTISQTDSTNTSNKRPRIVKPRSGDTTPDRQQPEAVKSVRGRRKPLYSRRNPLVPSIVKPAFNKTESTKAPKPAGNGKSPPGGAYVKKSNGRNEPANNVAKSNPKSKPIRPTSGARSMSPAGSQKFTNSKQNQVHSKLPIVNSERSRDSSTTRGRQADRPKPPIKQGTFTKESPTAVIPNISPSSCGSHENLDDNATPKSETNLPVKMREKNSSGTSLQSQRNSGGSSGNSQRNSGGTPPEPWSKALGSFNFITDSCQEQNYHSQFEQMKRNSREIPQTARQNTSGSNPKGPLNAPNKSGMGTARNSRSTVTNKATNGNLKKPGNGNTSKLNSGNLDRNNSWSTGNLRKTGSKANLKKSDSNMSLKKANENSRSSTPNGRRASSSLGLTRNQSSPGSFQTKRTESNLSGKTPISNLEGRKPLNANPAKKQVASKIASLWKKGDSGQDSSSPPESKPTKPPRQQRSASSGGGQRSRLIPPKSSAQKSCTAPAREGLCRTSTYDKISSFNEKGQRSPMDGNERSKMESSNGTYKLSDESDLTDNDDSRIKEGGKSVNGLTKTNSGTWKTQKSEAEARVLPDADETCRSGSSDQISPISKATTKPAGGTWRRYEENFWATHQLDQNGGDEVWVKREEISVEDQNIAPGEQMVADQSRRSRFNQYCQEKRLGLKQAYIASKLPSQTKAVPKETVIDYAPVEEKEGECKVELSPKTPPNEMRKPVCTEIRPQSAISAAIVPPFNYTPSAKAHIVNSEDNKNVQKAVNYQNKRSSIPSPSKHATKTEMLLARRRQSYLNSLKVEESEEEENRRSCLVTTV